MIKRSYKGTEINPDSVIYSSQFYLVTRETHFFCTWEVRANEVEPEPRNICEQSETLGCRFAGMDFDMDKAIERAVASNQEKQREIYVPMMQKIDEWKSKKRVTYPSEG